jgi:predicted ATPase
MRLNNVYISEYKNLKEFSLDFDGQSFIDVFVGKNGTGKSNIFEALIEIFRHLYEFGSHEINFDYSLKYEISGNLTEISWSNEQLKINGKRKKSIGKTPIPDNVLIYYSGHNAKVTELVQAYEESFKKKIKKADVKDTRKFIGVGKNYKQLLLAVLLLQDDDNKAKDFICKKLGITSIENVVKIVLKRPFYAKSNDYNIINNDESDRFWKPEGITKEFLNKLFICIADNSKGPIRKEGYFKDEDEYIYYFDIKAIQKEFYDFSSQKLFRQFDNLKTIEMLGDISVGIKLEDGKEASINYFSDGQLQSVYIYSIIELFKDRNCLTLLDEPDSFLHPEWQLEYLKQVFEIADNDSAFNHVLMSSHSASTLVSSNERKINLFQLNDNKVTSLSVSKNFAISQLSAGLITLNEEEQTLSIINRIRLENKPVLFTEGSSDPIVIETAWNKLKSTPLPFIPIYAFCHEYLSRLVQDEKIYNENNNNAIFGLFDFDDAYNFWNGIRNKGSNVEDDPFKGLCAKVNNQNGYVFLLPVPNNEIIKKQVIKDEKTNETFKHESRLSLELLFYEYLNENVNYDIVPCAGGEEVVFKGNKVKFAKEIIPTLHKDAFEVFRPIFDFIESKI